MQKHSECVYSRCGSFWQTAVAPTETGVMTSIRNVCDWLTTQNQLEQSENHGRQFCRPKIVQKYFAWGLRPNPAYSAPRLLAASSQNSTPPRPFGLPRPAHFCFPSAVYGRVPLPMTLIDLQCHFRYYTRFHCISKLQHI